MADTLQFAPFRRRLADATTGLPQLGVRGLRQPGTAEGIHAEHRTAMLAREFLHRVHCAIGGLDLVARPRRYINRSVPLASWVQLVEAATGKALGAGPVLAAACMRGIYVRPAADGVNACLAAGLAPGIVIGQPNTYCVPCTEEVSA